ncbi:MoaD/ThiS family protein [Chloroflexota bacterium]
MPVIIEFLGNQRIITRVDSIDLPITEKMTVNDAFKFVQQQYPDLHLDEGMILITVNKTIASLDRFLNINDTISFLPPISGG